MAHHNEHQYLHEFVVDYPEAARATPVLEIGAKQYGHGLNYRTLFPEATVVGVDQVAGEGVDVVTDLTQPDHALVGQTFQTILCCSVLEHCRQPWRLAEHITALLVTDGLLYVTVPWIWRTHAYPDDYWRMSVSGVQQLFPQITWKRVAYATQALGEFLHPKTPHDDGQPWRKIVRDRVYLCSQFVCLIGRKT